LGRVLRSGGGLGDLVEDRAHRGAGSNVHVRLSSHPTAVGAALGVLLVTAPDVGALRASAGVNIVGYGQ